MSRFIACFANCWVLNQPTSVIYILGCWNCSSIAPRVTCRDVTLPLQVCKPFTTG